MFFVDLHDSESYMKKEDESGLYEFVLGTGIEVTSIKNFDKNRLILDNLCKDKTDDKLMLVYRPPNSVYLHEDVFDAKNVTCVVNNETGRLEIQRESGCGASQGVLVTSGVLSGNGLVEYEKRIAYKSQYEGSVFKLVRLLAVGMRGDKLFGLYYIPSRNGIAVDLGMGRGISSVTYKEITLVGYKRYVLDDWFTGSRVKELGYAVGV